MFIYVDYYDKNSKDPAEYLTRFDLHMVDDYTPGHCMKEFDYNRPKMFAPEIAIIGAQSNITDSLGSYMLNLRKI